VLPIDGAGSDRPNRDGLRLVNVFDLETEQLADIEVQVPWGSSMSAELAFNLGMTAISIYSTITMSMVMLGL
jgi:hypothetical protein